MEEKGEAARPVPKARRGSGALSLHLGAAAAAPGQEGGLPAAGAGWAAHADSGCRGSLSVSLYVRSSNSPFFYYSGIRPKLY